MTATVRVSGLRGYPDLVRRLGGDPQQLARDCGIDPQILEDDNALIPYRQLIHLTEHCADALKAPDFGLQLAASQDIGILGPLAVAMQNSPNVEQAMLCAGSHLFIQSPALKLDIDDQGDETCICVQIRLSNMPHQGMRQAEDLACGVAHGALKLLAGEHYDLTRVELPHEALCSISVYKRHFGAPVLFGCETAALYVRTATMKTSLSDRSEQLHQLATSYLDVQFPTPDGLVTTRVETAVRRTLGTDSCNRTTVARAMAMHPRTLQRRLDREGESFDQIRDRIRREKAEYYLCKTLAPLSQVAGIIGYAEQSILTRSCQRWFGQSPRTFRAMHST